MNNNNSFDNKKDNFRKKIERSNNRSRRTFKRKIRDDSITKEPSTNDYKETERKVFVGLNKIEKQTNNNNDIVESVDDMVDDKHNIKKNDKETLKKLLLSNTSNDSTNNNNNNNAGEKRNIKGRKRKNRSKIRSKLNKYSKSNRNEKVTRKSNKTANDKKSMNDDNSDTIKKARYINENHLDAIMASKEIALRSDYNTTRQRERSKNVKKGYKPNTEFLSNNNNNNNNNNDSIDGDTDSILTKLANCNNSNDIEQVLNTSHIFTAPAPVHTLNYGQFMDRVNREASEKSPNISKLNNNKKNSNLYYNPNGINTLFQEGSIFSNNNANQSISYINNNSSSYDKLRKTSRASKPREITGLMAASDFAQQLRYILGKGKYFENLSKNINQAENFGHLKTKPHLLPRSHVGNLLATKYWHFKSCIKGKGCIAMQNFGLNSPLISYLSPDEWNECMEKGSVPATRRLCYICYLFIYGFRYYNNGNKGQSAEKIHTNFYQIGNKHGEYTSKALHVDPTRTTDKDANIPRNQEEYIGTGNCSGLTSNIVLLNRNNYKVITKKVKYPCIVQYKSNNNNNNNNNSSSSSSNSRRNNGIGGRNHDRNNSEYKTGIIMKEIEVQGLEELLPIFIKKNTTKTPINKTKPLTYIKNHIVYLPTTVSILRLYFSTKNKKSSVGLARLRHPSLAKELKVTTLYTYWCWVKLSHCKNAPKSFKLEPMPFKYIMCEDIRKTADNLEKILTGGRIAISYLFNLQKRLILNFPVDLNRPLNEYIEDFKKSRFNDDRRLLLAYILRCEILNTLIVCYKKTTVDNDLAVHKRLKLFFRWNLEQYGKHLFNKKSHPKVFDKIRDCCVYDRTQINYHLKDSRISQELLDKLCSKPVYYHFFAEDQELIKIRSERINRKTPEKYLRSIYKSNHSWIFVDFEKLRNNLINQNYESSFVFDQFNFQKHYKIPFNHGINFLNIPYEVFIKKYSIIWCIIVRINNSYELLIQERKKLSLLYENYRLNRKFYLSQYEKFEDEQSNMPAKKTNDGIDDNSTTSNSNNNTNNNHTMDVRNRLKCKIVNSTKQLLKKYRTRFYESKKNYKKQKTRVYRLHLFIYTHLSICQRLTKFKLLKDDDFESVPQSNSTSKLNKFITHYELAYPYANVMPHQGMLPDYAHLTTCINFVNPNSSEIRSQNPPVFMHMGRKFLPKCCQGRNKEQKHYEKCQENISYLFLTRICLEFMLLGAYKHGFVRPKFEQCIGIYSDLVYDFDKDRFLQLQKECPALNILGICVALVYWISLIIPYHRFILYKYPDYTKYERRVNILADSVRRLVKKKGIKSIDDFGILEKHVQNGFSTSMKIFLSENDPLSKQLNQDNNAHVYRSVFVNPISRLCKLISIVNSQRPPYYKRIPLDPLMKKCIIARIKSLKPNSALQIPKILLELNFNKEFQNYEDANVSFYTIYFMVLSFNKIRKGESDAEIVKELAKIPPKGWEIFDMFMNMLNSHYSINIIPLDSNIAKKQLEAVRRKFGTKDIHPSSISLIRTYCCDSIKTYDAQTSGPEIYGHSGIPLDLNSGKIFCKPDKSQPNKRRATRSQKEQFSKICDFIETNDDASLKKTFNRLRKKPDDWSSSSKYKNQPKCGEDEPAVIPLIGNVVQIRDTKTSTNNQDTPQTHSLTICTKCGGVTGFSRKLFGVNGFSCIICELSNVINTITPSCTVCSKRLPKNNQKKWHKYYVLDDDNYGGTWQFQNFFICDRCYMTSTSDFNPKFIHTKTELKSAKQRNQFGPIIDLKNGQRNVRHEFRRKLVVTSKQVININKTNKSSNDKIKEYCLSMQSA